MFESWKFIKIKIEYPQKEIGVLVSDKYPEIKEYTEIIDGDLCYFRKDKDNIFRVYKRIKGQIQYPKNLE